MVRFTPPVSTLSFDIFFYHTREPKQTCRLDGAKQLSILHLRERRWRLSPLLVVSGRPEDADALAGAPDRYALRAVDILHTCAIQAIWRLRCQVAIDSLPDTNPLLFSEHVLHLAEVQGLQY